MTDVYIPPEFEFYILEKDNVYRIVSVTKGNDPLYGNGTWNMCSESGPYNSYAEAEECIPQE